ncbi:MAG: 2Fe-2S iron-sulfur cluster binding domain-containing protein, partial [Clostridiales Family XIII bacterium]|nr:2Fe-2S iron-sulfur cluster binding domain-containing protein [Clostridiales Family XIII bacterium]
MGKGVFKQGHSQEHGTGLLRSARNDDMRNEPPGAALLTLVSSGEETVLHAPPGKDLLSLLRENGFYLPALCDGRGVCGKCKIRLLSGALEPSAADAAHFSAEELADGFRLACTACPEEDLRILAEERGEERFSAVNDFSSGENVLNNVRTECVPIRKIAASFARQATGAGGIPLHILRQCSALAGAPANSAFVYRDREAVVRVSIARKQLYAIGMDIGTTTLGLALVELESGRVVGTFSAVNRQRAFGADVISRIRRANDGDLSALSQSVRTQLSGAVAELCRAHGIDAADVVRIAVAANTSML